MCKAQAAVDAWYAEQKRLKKKSKKPKRMHRLNDVKYLKQLSYDQYLLSDHWKTKRKQALNHYGCFCNRCGSTELLQIHHRTYERLGCERMSDLEILCRDCHIAEYQHEKPWIKDSLTEEFISIYGVKLSDIHPYGQFGQV